MELQSQKQIQIEDYIEIILRRKWFIIVPFMISIIGVILALIVIKPMYKSSTLILVEPQKVPADYIRPTVTVDIRDRLNTITQQVMSRTRLESIINEFDLYHDQREKVLTEEIVEMVRKNIEISVKGKDSFTISYVGNHPETVMHVTNRLASLFIEENLKVREQQAEGTTEFLDAQLQDFRSALEKQEARIKAFKEAYMGELPSQLDANLRTLDRLQLDLKTTTDSLKSAEERKITLEKHLGEVNPDLVVGTGTGSTASVDPRRTRLASLQAELSQLSTVYTDRYPDIIRLKREIGEIEKELKESKLSDKHLKTDLMLQTVRANPLYTSLYNQLVEVNAEIKSLKERQKDIMKNISIFQGRVERIPAREQQMAALMRDYENTRANYQNILNKKLEAQLAENLEKRQKGEQFRILDPANLPSKPYKPDPKKIILMGIVLGLGSGGGLAFLLEYIDASFRKADDVYAALGLPVLASIPRIRAVIK